MSVQYRIYDVFAESAFAGTPIPVVLSDNDIDEQLKKQIVSEFSQAEAVFVDQSNKATPFSVYNDRGRTLFGAHTTLAAAQTAHELGFSNSQGGYFAYDLVDGKLSVNTYIDNKPSEEQLTLFSRTFDYTIDSYIPELSSIAEALKIDVKHLSYARYKPRLVHVDTPVLVVPMTKPEHVVAARLDIDLWSSLLSEIYARYILLVAPGSISDQAEFHGRLMHPDFKPKEYPPIGSVIPEFIAYLCSSGDASKGTHTVTIDRGSYDSRQSVIRCEFDYSGDNTAKCRIGGKVVLISEGQFVFKG